MKKAVNSRPPGDAEMLPEYDFSKGVRGKYAKRFSQGTNIIVLAPDVSEVFSDSESVNQALRGLIRIACRAPRRQARIRRTGPHTK